MSQRPCGRASTCLLLRGKQKQLIICSQSLEKNNIYTEYNSYSVSADEMTIVRLYAEYTSFADNNSFNETINQRLEDLETKREYCASVTTSQKYSRNEKGNGHEDHESYQSP